MDSENKNKFFHWFNLVAFKDQVSGSHLPDVHEKTLNDERLAAPKRRLCCFVVSCYCKVHESIFFSPKDCYLPHPPCLQPSHLTSLQPSHLTSLKVLLGRSGIWNGILFHKLFYSKSRGGIVLFPV